MVDSEEMTRDEERQERDEYDELSDERNPDYDLSEWGMRWDSEPDRKPWFLQRWFLLIVAFVVITSLMLPPLIIIF